MSPATLTVLINAGANLFYAIEKAMEEEEELPFGDTDFDEAFALFRDRQVHLGERFEAAMLRLNDSRGE